MLRLVAALCVVFQAIAMQVEVHMMDERVKPSGKLTWETMSSRDKSLARRQAETSHFTGSMSATEHSFAKQQGSEKELFALGHKDRDMARGQAYTRLGDEGKRTLRFLTTPVDKVSSHDLDLNHLANIRKQAEDRAKQLENDLAALQAPAQRQTELHSLMNSVKEAISKNMVEDEEMDLGEGMGMSAGKHERVEKAEQKAKIEMTAETKRHEADIKTYRREMKELVKKANMQQMKVVQKAQALVPAAVREYNQKSNEKLKLARKKSLAISEQAMGTFRKAQAASIKEKQELELRISSKTNEARGKLSKVKMEAGAYYQKQLALFENHSIKRIARGKKELVEARSRLEDQERRNREEGLSRSKRMQAQFSSMFKQMTARFQKSIKSLKLVESKGVKAAKKTYESEMSKAKKMTAMVKIQSSQVKKGAGIMLAESKQDSSRAEKEKSAQLRTRLAFKSKERARKRKTKRKKRKIIKEENKFDLTIIKERKEIAAKEKVREKAMARKDGVSAAEYKKRQMSWLAMVKKNARKNCLGAKREAILKTRAGRFATDRLSRMSQDMATMKNNILQDVKVKGKKTYNRKERASKTLKKIVQAQAKAMQENEEVPHPNFDLQGIPNIIRCIGGSESSSSFCKSFRHHRQDESLTPTPGPEKSEEQIIKEASEKAKTAKKSAKKHSAIWAKKQSEKTAKNLKKTANHVCHKEQLKYETVKFRVRKRLGKASEADHKKIIKGQFAGKKWALEKVNVQLGKKKKLSEVSEKKKTQLSEKEKKSEKMAEQKEKKKMRASKERQKKFAQAGKKREQTAKAKLKAAAAKRKRKTTEAKKLMKVAEKSFKAQRKDARLKLKQGVKKIKEANRREQKKLSSRKQKAMEKLAKGAKNNLKGGFERMRKKAQENQKKAKQAKKERVKKAEQKRDVDIKKIKLKTKQNVSELKLKLKKGMSSQNKRMLRNKLVLSRQKQEAKKVLAEATRTGAGAKQNVIYDAKLKAEKMIRTAKAKVTKVMKDARRIFIKKVKTATAKYLKHIKASKQKIKAALG